MKQATLILATTLCLVAAGILPSASLASGTTVSLWHMDETSGTTMNDSTGTNAGSLSNVTLGVPGLVNTGYSFDGVSSIVTVPDNSSLDPGVSNFSFTVSAQFTLIPSKGNDYDLMRKGLNTDDGGDYKLEILPGAQQTIAQAHCEFSGSIADIGITAGPNLADGNWHTITCTKTAISISVTIDGTSYSKLALVGAMSNGAPLTLGGKLKGKKVKDAYIGALDEASFNTG